MLGLRSSTGPGPRAARTQTSRVGVSALLGTQKCRAVTACPAVAALGGAGHRAPRGAPARATDAPAWQQQLRSPFRQRYGSQGRRTVKPAQAAAASGLASLGFDFLTFLASTVAVVPVCKSLKISPVLGFLGTGLVLQQLGLLNDREDVERLSELGVLFLLFEMGLELSLDRLKSLSKYAFGMGSLQVLITGLIFAAFVLPAGGESLGTKFLELTCGAQASLVSVRSLDEAAVIAAALSMSSSAFVLQLLSERGETPTRFGSATLGILLFQDIAVVPFLVLLPLIESNGGMENATSDTLLGMLGPTAFNSAAGLVLLLLAGRFVLRRIFELVAESRSSETFVALCLLTVVGASQCTSQLGMSDTLGAFIAGVLLSETSFRTQVEADIRPFKGLLLGLFFVCVGSSIDFDVFRANWDVCLWMLAGLLSIKAGVNIALGPLFGLTRGESIRTGFMLAQGGEFAFVLLSLALELDVLPASLNQILIIVVVMSMALTPGLAEAGKAIANELDRRWPEGGALPGSPPASPSEAELVRAPGGGRRALGCEGGGAASAADDPVVILGFGPQGQMLANMIASPLAAPSGAAKLGYVAFDLNPARVAASRQAGFAVVYGDGSRTSVLHAAGVHRPKAVAVCYSDLHRNKAAVELIAAAFPGVRIYACAKNFREAAALRGAGAARVSITANEAGLNLGTRLLSDVVGEEAGGADTLRRGIQKSLEVRTDALRRRLKAVADDKAKRGPAGLPSSLSEALNGGGGAVKMPTKEQIELFVLDPAVAGSVSATAAAAGDSPARPGTLPRGPRDGSVPLMSMSMTDSMGDEGGGSPPPGSSEAAIAASFREFLSDVGSDMGAAAAAAAAEGLPTAWDSANSAAGGSRVERGGADGLVPGNGGAAAPANGNGSSSDALVVVSAAVSAEGAGASSSSAADGGPYSN
ncbi:MAG: Sodium/hydrogen exchanger family-domain-containing protein [Monoraphidium minutum]|nr:MAG: Sodium/hydrogen exchanger family-domain-containing protein [Monoraphidium minutum]